ncbi:hypothetical protein LCGC14_1693530, partial [marine sediment metagenome]
MALLTAEIKVDARMIEGMVAAMAKRFVELLREHAERPGTPPEVAEWVERTTAVIEKEFENFAIHRGLEIVWALIGDANRYFAGEEPWAHKKSDPPRMRTILYV